MDSTLGILFKHEDTDDFMASFSAIGQLVSILPMNDSSRNICRILQYNDKSDDNDSWFYRQSGNYAIAILRRGAVPTSLNSMNSISFHSPMILKGIVWNEGVGIYNHLKLLIYLSVNTTFQVLEKIK